MSSNIEESVVSQISAQRGETITYMNERCLKNVDHLDKNKSLMNLTNQVDVTCIIVLDPMLTVNTPKGATGTP